MQYEDFEEETNTLINTLYGFDKREVNYIEKMI
jgi:hypothetical protein